MLRQVLRIRGNQIRQFSSTSNRLFLTDFFGKKDLNKVVEKQDDFESDKEGKITILSKENSPNTPDLYSDVDLEGQVLQWKDANVKSQDLEQTYNSQILSEVFNQTYQELKGEAITTDKYTEVSLEDIQFRFQLAKALQKKLGFDFNDYQVTRSHTLNDLYSSVNNIVTTRWVSERNPNGIVLRADDFNAGNIYLNEELTQVQQDDKLSKLAAQAEEHNLSILNK